MEGDCARRAPHLLRKETEAQVRAAALVGLSEQRVERLERALVRRGVRRDREGGDVGKALQRLGAADGGVDEVAVGEVLR